ncbi:MAG: hypothetical protein E5X74_00995 [Mesorhizobium sp.]|nr:MAG: hypothetical protein E5X75_06250 [Mesorhizobium sp.]TIO87620.1 MAG: hypothetical protein E5X74_00995 [Mesorhizobium sp.]
MSPKSAPRFWVNDMHQNKDLRRVAWIRFVATRFRDGWGIFRQKRAGSETPAPEPTLEWLTHAGTASSDALPASIRRSAARHDDALACPNVSLCEVVHNAATYQVAKTSAEAEMLSLPRRPGSCLAARTA